MSHGLSARILSGKRSDLSRGLEATEESQQCWNL